MSKENKKEKQAKKTKFNTPSVSEDKLIEIHAEAYYKALKRIEDEKEKCNSEITEENKKTWFDNICIILNVLVCPFRIFKPYRLSGGIYDNLLVVIISTLLKIIGGLLWLVGWYAVGYDIILIWQNGFAWALAVMIIVGISFVLLGSMLVLAGKEFNKETDSNKIYAYSASIIALISCVVSVIALFKGAH